MTTQKPVRKNVYLAKLGFKSLEEYAKMLENVDISTRAKYNDFDQWYRTDLTRAGLDKLPVKKKV